jgi:hypothetical protein
VVVSTCISDVLASDGPNLFKFTFRFIAATASGDRSLAITYLDDRGSRVKKVRVSKGKEELTGPT